MGPQSGLEKLFSRRAALRSIPGAKGDWRHTDLVLDEPAGQLLREAVAFPLEAPDEDSLVVGLHVEGPIHRVRLAERGALHGGRGPGVGAGARPGA